MLPKRAIGQVSSHSVVLGSPLAFWVSVSRTVAHRSSSPAATATSLFIVLLFLRCCKSLRWKWDFNVSKFFGNDWNLMCKQRPSVDVVRQMCWRCWVNRLWVGGKAPGRTFFSPTGQPLPPSVEGREEREVGQEQEAFPVQWTGGLWFVFPQASQNTCQVCSCLALWGPQGRQTYDVKGFLLLLLLLFGFSVLTWNLAAPPDQREEWSLPGFGLMDRQWVEKSKSKGDGM